MAPEHSPELPQGERSPLPLAGFSHCSYNACMTEPTLGRVFYGSYWRIASGGVAQWDAAQLLYKALQDTGKVQEDDELADHIDVLVTEYNAQVTYVNKEYTVYFGHNVLDLSSATNDFSEMALLSVMDLSNGVLREDVKEDVKRIIEQIPMGLREKLSRPGFHVAWGTT